MSPSEPLLTIFTAPKPFINPHISMIQRNAILSWHCLGEDVNVLMVGDEPGMAEFAKDTGTQQLAEVDINFFGTPLVSSVFDTARQATTSPLLAYVNADVLLTPKFVDVARQIYSQLKKFVIVGQRYNLDVKTPLDFYPGWDLYLLSETQIRGHLSPADGSDYFIFPRDCFTNLPDFTIGRGGWDNWMLFHARSQSFPVVDATPSITAIHQDHDFSHLPEGQPHFRLPETTINIHLAGGPRNLFTLADANFTFHYGQLDRIALHSRKLLREIEIFPLIHPRYQRMADTFFAFFHPITAWKERRMRNAQRESNELSSYE